MPRSHLGRLPRVRRRHRQRGPAAVVPRAPQRGSVKGKGRHLGALQGVRQGRDGRVAQAGGL
eukprot:7324955-Heterocapsa_arctica.AAC.1